MIEQLTRVRNRKRAGQVRHTSSHELFHRTQYAIGRQGTSMSESTARRFEGLAWPQVEFPRGITIWFLNPHFNLWSIGNNKCCVLPFTRGQSSPPTGSAMFSCRLDSSAAGAS
jgi:hypothetical protein